MFGCSVWCLNQLSLVGQLQLVVGGLNVPHIVTGTLHGDGQPATRLDISATAGVVSIITRGTVTGLSVQFSTVSFVDWSAWGSISGGSISVPVPGSSSAITGVGG